jgi:lipopolysaccharide transport system ATP-binding protein
MTADSNWAIRVRNLGKSYPSPRHRLDALLDHLRPGRRGRTDSAWALRDVSFEVQRGEFFGVIGRNGAGKSTLLQLLAGVLQATEGEIQVKGRVLALLELGAGLDPQSTGRENARLQMALLGVKRADVEAKIKAVAEFAELGDAFDHVVNTYSSGMFLRLAFAVTTVLEPDVLLVDEALAVGDVFFQQKCFARLEAIRGRGGAIILVSHNLQEVQDHCQRVLWLEQGKTEMTSDPSQTLARFMASQPRPAVSKPNAAPASQGRTADWDGVLSSFALLDADGKSAARIEQGATFQIVAEYVLDRAVDVPLPGFEIEDVASRRVHARHLLHEALDPPVGLPKGTTMKVVHLVQAWLPPGHYTVRLGLGACSREVLATREVFDPDDLWGQAETLCRTKRLATFEVVLPKRAYPMRERFVGATDLPVVVELVVQPPGKPQERRTSASRRSP